MHGHFIAASGVSLALMFGFLTAPAARAFPAGSCSPVGTVAPQPGSFTVCTDDGWKHVFQPMQTAPLAGCDNVGAAVPDNVGVLGYHLCTNLGQLYVPRIACMDFPGRFTCKSAIIVTPA